VSGRDEAVWIERFAAGAVAPGGAGGGSDTVAVTVAVKDLVDVAGHVTTAGCLAVADRARPADRDAVCIERVRAGGGLLLGKVNLHELAFGTTGENPWYGTPENPADPGRVPGGSSSGSAVAVATGEADVAIGSDTGGSVRIPAACCGVVGLKTTFGRIPVEGVWPLAPSFDTVGPLGASVATVARGMELLESGFAVADPASAGVHVGRARLGPDVSVDPVIDAAVDEALRLAELEVADTDVAGWADAWRSQQVLLGLEAIATDGWLLEESGGRGISAATLDRFRRSEVSESVASAARAGRDGWVAPFVDLVRRVGVLALPTLAVRPPVVGEAVVGFNVLCAPVNLAGLPAVSLPVPAPGRPPVGLQLVGPPGGEEQLLAVAARVEAAVGR
jgi:amidase